MKRKAIDGVKSESLELQISSMDGSLVKTKVSPYMPGEIDIFDEPVGDVYAVDVYRHRCLMFAIEQHKHKAELMIELSTTDFYCFWQELNFFAWFVANFPTSEGPSSPCASIRPKCRGQRPWQSRASNKLALYRVSTRQLPRHSASFSWRSKTPVTSQDFSFNLQTKTIWFARPNDSLI